MAAFFQQPIHYPVKHPSVSGACPVVGFERAMPILITALIYLIFFLSGATALVYEVVWVRKLSLVFGGSHLAVTTVLAVVMGGLPSGAGSSAGASAPPATCCASTVPLRSASPFSPCSSLPCSTSIP